MKKFKHIPTGNIYEHRGENKYVYHEGSAIPFEIVTTGNDWIEIKDKPEWIILSFVNNGKTGGEKGFIIPLNKDGYYYNDVDGTLSIPKSECTLERLLTAKFADIHSVRRESDGEVFTIGDKYDLGGTITGFVLDDYGLFVSSEQFKKASRIDLVKKVKPKEWEITALRGIGHSNKHVTSTLRNNGKFLNATMSGDGYVAIEDVNWKSWEIYSVRRLSDGVEFKIDDRIKNNVRGKARDTGVRQITYFEIVNGQMELNDGINHYTFNINEVDKVEKLFTTEDRVDIYNGDEIHWVVSDFRIFKGTANQIHKTNGTVYPTFSTKEAAEEYVLMNKPCLSVKDVYALVGITSKMKLDSIKNFVRNKLK